MAYELKDYLKAINESKEDLMKSDETWIKKYPAYIINRCLSMFWDTLPQSNEMNGYHFLTNQVQFQFLFSKSHVLSSGPEIRRIRRVALGGIS